MAPATLVLEPKYLLLLVSAVADDQVVRSECAKRPATTV